MRTRPEHLQEAGAESRPALHETKMPRSTGQWLGVTACALVAFLLMAPLPFTVAWNGSLGPTPGAFLIGASFIVMGVSIKRGPGARNGLLDRIRKWLLAVGIVLALAGTFVWRMH